MITIAEVTLGVFDSRENANRAIDELDNKGFDVKQISVITRDWEGREAPRRGAEEVAAGTAEGVAVGGTLGALAGLLIGIGVITVPGIGALLIGGPVAAALGLTGAAATTVSGAVTGALAGGLVGALTNMGLPEETARDYERRIREGGVLVAVPSNGKRAENILRDYGADQIRKVNMPD